jgi:site-specific recombinase XerC
VLEQAWLLGQMSAEDYHRAARLAPVIGETLPAGRELLAEEIASLIQNCIEDHSPIGIRDAAIISILFGQRQASCPIVGIHKNGISQFLLAWKF